MSFSFPAFSYTGPRLPMAELPVAPPISMPTFDDELDDIDVDSDADEIDGGDDPDDTGDDTSGE